MKKNFLVLAILLAGGSIAIMGGLAGCQKGDETAELTIFHAGSLSVPLREVSELFMQEHPGVIVRAEAAGSRQCARKICDLGLQCDVMASADYKVVANLLMPEFADFNIRFAFNEMVIAYTDKSRYGDEVSAQNWHEILLREQVRFGRSDPDTDPCGYRSLMVFQLAQKHYAVGGLAEKLAQKDHGKYIRPKETDLLALLEVGEIDYLFIYRSVARQHGLKMILLPEEINLKSPAFTDLYHTAAVKVSGKKPGEFITIKGEPMVYSVTIPKSAPNPQMAQAWVALLLSPKGRAIMEKNGQPCMTPAQADGIDKLPQKLVPFCQ